MAKYSVEFKNSIISKMMPPQNRSVSDLSGETGVPKVTLYTWRRQASEKGLAVPGAKQILNGGAHKINSKLFLKRLL